MVRSQRQGQMGQKRAISTRDLRSRLKDETLRQGIIRSVLEALWKVRRRRGRGVAVLNFNQQGLQHSCIPP